MVVLGDHECVCVSVRPATLSAPPPLIFFLPAGRPTLKAPPPSLLLRPLHRHPFPAVNLMSIVSVFFGHSNPPPPLCDAANGPHRAAASHHLQPTLVFLSSLYRLNRSLHPLAPVSEGDRGAGNRGAVVGRGDEWECRALCVGS